MRIWSIHPKYLDAKGLVALWRETLLAKNVLLGNTKGYRNHPQLLRFKETNHQLDAINSYLSFVFKESVLRGYSFNKEKVDWSKSSNKINVTNQQIQFERNHLLLKLEKRDPELYNKLKNESLFEPHPLFNIVNGDIEDWEVLYTN